MEHELLHKLRRKVAGNRGLRKIRAEAELVEYLVQFDNKEAYAIARDAAERARTLLHKARQRNTDPAAYELHLARSLRALSYSLQTREPYSESPRELLAESIELFQKNAGGQDLIKCYQLLHMYYREQELYEAALDALDRALEIGREFGEHGRDAYIHGARGSLHGLLGTFQAAKQAFEQGLAIAGKLDDTYAKVVILGGMGWLYEDYGFAEQALESYRAACTLERQHRTSGNKSFAIILGNLARLCWARGGLQQAKALFAESAALAGAANLLTMQAFMLCQAAHINIVCAEYEAALACLQQASPLYEQAGNTLGLVLCRALTGTVYQHSGESGIARIYLAESCAALNDLDLHPADEGSEFLQSVALLASCGGETFAAERFTQYYTARLAEIRTDEAVMKRLYLSEGLGLLHEFRADYAAARPAYLRVLALCRRMEFRYTEANVHYYLGRLLVESGDGQAALPPLEAALHSAVAIGAGDLARRVHAVLAVACTKCALPRQARAHGQKVTALAQETLPPRVLLALQLHHERAENRRLRHEAGRLRENCAAAQAHNEALERLLDSKNTHIKHLADSLQNFAAALGHDPDESDPAYRLRAGQLARDMRAAVAGRHWGEFEEEARNQDDDFLLRLARSYPQLTPTERKVCALMRLNYTTKDLSHLLHLSPRSVQAYRHRIRKKLDIPSDADLNAFILELLYPQP